MGIVLSGTGSDGSKGLKMISDSGGLTLVQAPETAAFDGMPNTAARILDEPIVLPVSKMKSLIFTFQKDPKSLFKIQTQGSVEGINYQRIFKLLEKNYHIDFDEYKTSTMYRRINKRMSTKRISSLSSYVAKLESNEEEREALYQDLLIGVTSFFRDKEAFAQLEHKIIPALIDEQLNNDKQTLRIWVTACSTGEEVYSLAILIEEYIRKNRLTINYKIFATDVNERSVKLASKGVFLNTVLSKVPDTYRQRYFRSNSSIDKVVSNQIRNSVVFSKQNLINDPPFTNIHLCLCRNFLIYCDKTAQKNALDNLKYSLCIGGYLMLGPSESILDDSEAFEEINKTWNVYKKLMRTPLPVNRGMKKQFNKALSNISTSSSIDKLKEQSELNLSVKEDYLDLSIYSSALEYALSAAFIVDRNNQILHFIGRAYEYVAVKGRIQGLPTIDSAVDGLLLPLRKALLSTKASKNKTAFEATIKKKGTTGESIIVEVFPLTGKAGSVGSFLITIVPKETVGFIKEVVLTRDDKQLEKAIISLEDELKVTKESLQATIEELETTNEELQSTNEELTSSNEELQTTNEELHSVNEELYTVNSEFQIKIEELTQARSDIDNLLTSTNVGAIFLGENFDIRFFTPTIAQHFNLTEKDLGRNILTFSLAISYDCFESDLRHVLASQKELKKEVIDKNGKWYDLRIFPYVLANNTVSGVVVTMVDVSEFKILLDKAELSKTQLDIALKEGGIGSFRYNIKNDQFTFDDQLNELFGADFCVASRATLNNFYDKTHPSDRKNIEMEIERAIKTQDSFSCEFRLGNDHTNIKHLCIRGRFYNEKTNKQPFLTGICWDVTQRVRTEHKLVEFESRKLAMDDITDGWWDWNLETNDEYLSPKFKAMFGYKDHEIQNSVEAWQSLIFKEDLEPAVNNAKAHIESKGKVPYLQEVRYTHKDGHTVYVICRGKGITNAEGKITRIIGTHTDITDSKTADYSLIEKATIDELTGLDNRSSFMTYISKAIKRSERKNKNIAVCFIDLDDFKKINDSMGHNVGDAILAQVSKRLKDCLRGVDFIARLGGDEFAVICEELDSPHEVSAFAKRCINALSRPIKVYEHQIHTSLSIGIAIYPFAGTSKEDLLKNADIAMYRAKDKGKNQFEFYSKQLNQEKERLLLIERDLHYALDENQFCLVYQPMFDLKTMKIVGFEALIRWNHPLLGSIPPLEFIPISEEAGYITKIGEWVITESSRHIQKFQSLLEEKLHLSINFSANQLQKFDFKHFTEKTFNKQQGSENIIIEITESALIKDIKSASKIFKKLRKQGFNIAIDDFGTGYSSLQYLKDLDIDILKIDKSFVLEIENKKGKPTLINAIIDMAEALNLNIIVEGIETKKQLQYLQNLELTNDKIHYWAQGYYLSRPLEENKIIEYIKSL